MSGLVTGCSHVGASRPGELVTAITARIHPGATLAQALEVTEQAVRQPGRAMGTSTVWLGLRCEPDSFVVLANPHSQEYHATRIGMGQPSERTVAEGRLAVMDWLYGHPGSVCSLALLSFPQESVLLPLSDDERVVRVQTVPSTTGPR